MNEFTIETITNKMNNFEDQFKVIFSDIKGFYYPNQVDETLKEEIELFLAKVRAYKRKLNLNLIKTKRLCPEKQEAAEKKSELIEEFIISIERIEEMVDSITEFTEMYH